MVKERRAGRGHGEGDRDGEDGERRRQRLTTKQREEFDFCAIVSTPADFCPASCVAGRAADEQHHRNAYAQG
eukprot:6200275-Pleurochrysis_carterae.AAC.1